MGKAKESKTEILWHERNKKRKNAEILIEGICTVIYIIFMFVYFLTIRIGIDIFKNVNALSTLDQITINKIVFMMVGFCFVVTGINEIFYFTKKFVEGVNNINKIKQRK